MARKLAAMYHKLSVLVGGGVPILQALRNTAKKSRGKIKKALRGVADEISAGSDIKAAMSKYPGVFLPLDLVLVGAGEESGNMTEVLGFLSKWYDFRNHMRRIVVSGMVLPVFLIHFAAVVGPAPGFVLKRYSLTSYYLQGAIILAFLYVPVVVILGILRLTPQAGVFRWLLDGFTLRIPILGRAIKGLAMSRFCKAFSMLYKAGVPIIQSVELASGITGNAVITGMLKGGARSGRGGESICKGFSRRLGDDFVTIWEVGEESGKLDESVEHLADEYAEVTEMLFNELAKWLPRLVYFGVLAVMAVQIIKGWSAIYSFEALH